MAYGNYYDPEDDFPPAPNVPAPNGGGGAPAPSGPSGSMWNTTGGEAPVNSGGGGGGGGAPVRPQFTGYNAPGAPKFEVKPFVAPDREALLSDPGYQARLDAGTKALERSAAAKGWLRTGGHGANLVDYSQGQASQEYGQAFNRGTQAYDRYYQGQKDAYAPQFARWQMNADAGKQAALLGYNTDLSQFLQSSAPHYSPEPNFYDLLGPEIAPPTYGGGGGYGPPSGGGGSGYGDDGRRPRYDY